MTQHTSGTRCLLCINEVKQQGDVCSQCKPTYMALERELFAYERQLHPILAASSHTHITAPMRCVSDVYFYLKELDAPIPSNEQMMTHRLTVIGLTLDGSLQQDSWYGDTISSTFLVATINRDFTKMGFPEEPDYFVPISSWKPVASPDTNPKHNEATGGGGDGQR